ncbi:GNAT family N-acetyltransferase [Fictibacillus sp. NPDC058756]|uniref:GNAT family N-acetyltransferase n=1 Tax=Fictibacillus sp. NPDC058756 TaxID=3346625 RepID=UPI003681BF96
MNIHKIFAAYNTDNPASGKVMGKAGMEQEGTIRHMIRNAKGQFMDFYKKIMLINTSVIKPVSLKGLNMEINNELIFL